MYHIKDGVKEKLLDGRTVAYLTRSVGVSRSYIVNILNSKTGAIKPVAESIMRICRPEANIEDYFYKKGE